MLTNPQQRYQQTSIQTASPSKLLLALYDGAIRFVKQGIEGIENGNPEKANHNLLKAQNIIHEFIASLKFEYAISDNFLRIYEYMLHRLIEANIKKSKDPAVEVLSYLMELREAWAAAANRGAATQAADHG